MNLGWVVQIYNTSEALPNLINPFWMLPFLGLLKVKARDLIGYGMLYFMVNFVLVLFFMWLFARHFPIFRRHSLSHLISAGSFRNYADRRGVLVGHGRVRKGRTYCGSAQSAFQYQFFRAVRSEVVRGDCFDADFDHAAECTCARQGAGREIFARPLS